MPFLDSLDIANRALQLCGVNAILDTTEDSTNNAEASNAYDKLRRVELRRNVWRFAVRKAVLRPVDTTTLLLSPTLYSPTKTYLSGAVAEDANNQPWLSLIPDNLNNPPGGNNEAWAAFFGPLTVTPWDSGTTYYAGELVYKAGAAPGSYQVYMSLANANADQPDVATAWDSATTYYADQVVSYSASLWRNLLPFNLGLTPSDGPGTWSATATYAAGNQVTGSNHRIYTSVTNGNTGNDPTTDSGTNWTDTGSYNGWARSPALTTAAISWLPLGDTALEPLSIVYPLGSGPWSQSTTKNIYRLPAGYLRKAPQDPRGGHASALGGPSSLTEDDWEFTGDYIVSASSDPIVLRFVADVTKVREMDDMFCEGLACRMATAMSARLTQSNADLQSLASQYKLFMSEARMVNAIEEGPQYPPEDEFITVRY